MKVGLISDTHGLLRPEALEAMRGCAHIIHAGDIGDRAIIAALEALAPLTAVRGNNDRGTWARKLPHACVVRLGEAAVYVIHDLKALDLDPVAEGFAAVISGHSHKPGVREEGTVLFVNPGSAGPRRFKLPICVGYLQVRGRKAHAELRTL